MANKGFIYIMTNPSFKEYVKIGYATDVKQRLDELNRSSAVPFAFRVYATYEVDSALSDKKLHTILDKLNPDLRSMEEIDGKKRIREFYAMTPEDAYSILDAIAEINGYQHRLKKWKATAEEQKDEQIAEQVRDNARRGPFRFSKYGIPAGAVIEFVENSEIKATVIDDRRIEYEGEQTSVSALAQRLKKFDHPVQGTLWFSYKGERLADIRDRAEAKKE